ncbi:MAG: glycoside hydrolase family 28 protein, partial [Planctomycetota bacterium]
MSTHLITDFGAVADGQTVNTQAIQRAVDAAAADGGGVVIIPAGTFVSGTIYLKSRVTLEVQPAGVLLGSGDIADYPEDYRQRKGDRHRHHFLLADDCDNITLRGGGTIDGNGPAFWKEQKGPRQWIGAKHPRVSPMFEIRNCRDVRIEDVTIRNSPGWTVHPYCCDRVWIRAIRLLNPLFGPNTDGLDINGCRDVFVSDCHIECGDDAIVLKTTEDSRSCERVAVSNCVMRTNCVALKCGTESWHDFRQIAFSNCVVYKSTRAFGLYAKDGGVMEDIAVTGIVCDTDSGMILNRPIHIDAVDRTPESIKSTIRNVQISNFVARTDG